MVLPGLTCIDWDSLEFARAQSRFASHGLAWSYVALTKASLGLSLLFSRGSKSAIYIGFEMHHPENPYNVKAPLLFKH